MNAEYKKLEKYVINDHFVCSSFKIHNETRISHKIINKYAELNKITLYPDFVYETSIKHIYVMSNNHLMKTRTFFEQQYNFSSNDLTYLMSKHNLIFDYALLGIDTVMKLYYLDKNNALTEPVSTICRDTGFTISKMRNYMRTHNVSNLDKDDRLSTILANFIKDNEFIATSHIISKQTNISMFKIYEYAKSHKIKYYSKKGHYISEDELISPFVAENTLLYSVGIVAQHTGLKTKTIAEYIKEHNIAQLFTKKYCIRQKYEKIFVTDQLERLKEKKDFVADKMKISKETVIIDYNLYFFK